MMALDLHVGLLKGLRVVGISLKLMNLVSIDVSQPVTIGRNGISPHPVNTSQKCNTLNGSPRQIIKIQVLILSQFPTTLLSNLALYYI